MGSVLATNEGRDIAPGCSCGGYVPDSDIAAEIAKYRTADRVPLTDGLRVFTNDLSVGVVDLSRASVEHNWNSHRNALWFDVVEERNWKGEPVAKGRGVLQSDDRVTTRYNGKKA